MRSRIMLVVLALGLSLAAATALWAQGAGHCGQKAAKQHCAMQAQAPAGDCCQDKACCDATCCADGRCASGACCGEKACCDAQQCCADGKCQDCAEGCCTQTEQGMQCNMSECKDHCK